MYNFVKIEPKFYGHIKTLYARCFNVDISISEIEKKYNTTFFGCRDIGFLAMDDSNTPAAYYGAFPMRLNYRNKDFLVAQSGDTMTDPNHQKKGLFVQLATKTYDLAKSEGIQFVFGFPNENSYPGFKNKLNWVFIGEMLSFNFVNFTIPFCEIAHRFSFIKSLYDRIVQLILRRKALELSPENILAFQSQQWFGCINKDVNFFEYKLNNLNTHLIDFKGFKLLIKASGHLIIGEVAYFEYSKLNDFLYAIKCLGLILFARKTVLTLSPNHWLFGYLNKVKKPTKGLPIGFCNMSDDKSDFENIIFCHADFDTF